MMPAMGMSTPQPQQYTQQFVFPQPIGNVYNLNSSTDIGNIPAAANVTVGLCLNENLLYVKTLQNGMPSLLSYRLSPLEGQPVSQQTEVQKSDDYTQLVGRIEKIEKMLFAAPAESKPVEANGGRLNWQV